MEKRGAQTRDGPAQRRPRRRAAPLQLSSFHRVSRRHRRHRAGQGRSVAVTPRTGPRLPRRRAPAAERDARSGAERAREERCGAARCGALPRPTAADGAAARPRRRPALPSARPPPPPPCRQRPACVTGRARHRAAGAAAAAAAAALPRPAAGARTAPSPHVSVCFRRRPGDGGRAGSEVSL